MKKVLSLLLAAAVSMSVLLAGCSSTGTESSAASGTESAAASSEGASEETTEASGKSKIAYVTGTGGLGDKAFNDLGNKGIQQLESEGIECDVVEPKAIAELEGILRNLADTESYALIVAMGGDAVDSITRVANDYPEQNFMVMDGLAGDIENLRSVMLSQTDECFLVGAFAGLMELEGNLPNSQGQNTIGVVGGMDIPLIRSVVAAYTAGAKYVNPDCEVLSAYVGSWSDPNKGAELTTSMYSQGASIVFNGAGASGMGCIEAAQQEGLYVIGYDGNQNSLAPDNVIGSGIRGLDAVIVSSAKEALDGTFTGGDMNVTMADNPDASQLEFSETNVEIPDSVIEKLDQIKEFLIAAEVAIPEDPADVDAYLEQVGTFEG